MADKEDIEETGSDISKPRIRYAPTNGAIIYPESDGKPMAETEIHRNAIMNALLILIEAFKNKPDVCVSGNIFREYDDVLYQRRPEEIRFTRCLRFFWYRQKTAAHIPLMGRRKTTKLCVGILK